MEVVNLQITKQTSYSFDKFIELRNELNDFDNPFLKQIIQKYAEDEWETLEARLNHFSQKLSTKWRKWTDDIARPENHPKLLHYDAFNHRIDRIVQPLEARMLTEEVKRERLFSSALLPYEGITKRYLLHGNGESGITCPLACTDGLIALIEEFIDEVPNEVRKMYLHAKEGIDGDFAIGAQFMSEIQGGSNIPANVLRAVPEKNYYRLYGNKFFCSAVHADYSVVTARLEGTNDIALFVVPTWLPGDKEKEKRNGHVVNRLKWKIGTTELPSGEIDYNGAVAYLIGPKNRGVALAVSIVLTRSRLDIGFASASFIMRAAREAKLYARFRQVFDRKIDEFPMAAAQLEDLEEAAKRMVATAFKIYDAFLKYDPLVETAESFATRELILLQKIFSSKEAVNQLRTAISIFGGHGAIEDFSSIPRLFRDSIVNELWEGPSNVLLAQIYRDLHKLRSKFSIKTFLNIILPHLSQAAIDKYAGEIEQIMVIDLTAMPTWENCLAARKWEQVWREIFIHYQQLAVSELQDLPILDPAVLVQTSK
jgi:hypothetical protein